MKNTQTLKRFFLIAVVAVSTFSTGFILISSENGNNIQTLKSAQNDRVFIFGAGTAEAVTTLEPATTFSSVIREITDQVVEGLLAPNLNNTVDPISFRLARAYSWIDNKTLELKLQENVQFHDGTNFTADAVKWNFDRIANLN